ncbi:MAG: hypothetical protein ACWGQW_08640, partial [bacterium]
MLPNEPIEGVIVSGTNWLEMGEIVETLKRSGDELNDAKFIWQKQDVMYGRKAHTPENILPADSKSQSMYLTVRVDRNIGEIAVFDTREYSDDDIVLGKAAHDYHFYFVIAPGEAEKVAKRLAWKLGSQWYGIIGGPEMEFYPHVLEEIEKHIDSMWYEEAPFQKPMFSQQFDGPAYYKVEWRIKNLGISWAGRVDKEMEDFFEED